MLVFCVTFCTNSPTSVQDVVAVITAGPRYLGFSGLLICVWLDTELNMIDICRIPSFNKVSGRILGCIWYLCGILSIRRIQSCNNNKIIII